MRILLYVWLIIACSSIVSAGLISEIMYNPPGNDNNKEFIEAYLAGNLTKVCDTDSCDNLTLLKYVNSSNTSLIVEEGFNFSGLNCSIYSAGATIGNNLGNTNDNLFIYDTESEINASYNSSSFYFANGNNGSIEFRNNTFIDNQYPNPCIYDVNESMNTSSEINTTINETGNATNQTNTTHLCAPVLSISLKKNSTIFNQGESIKFYNVIENASLENFSIEYWIEDMKGNIVKSKRTTNNLNEKSYTPPASMGEKVLFIRSILTTNCTNKTYSSKMIVYNGTGQDSQADSSSTPSSSSNKGAFQYFCSLEGEDELDILGPERITNSSFETIAEVVNDKDTAVYYEIWSYLYRGSKTYTGDREANKIGFTVDRCKKRTIYLNNRLEDAENGEYRLKVKLLREGRKTPIEETKDIIVDIQDKHPEITSTTKKKDTDKDKRTKELARKKDSQEEKNNTAQGITGNVIYDPEQKKDSNMTMVYLGGVIIVLLIIKSLLFKKREKVTKI